MDLLLCIQKIVTLSTTLGSMAVASISFMALSDVIIIIILGLCINAVIITSGCVCWLLVSSCDSIFICSCYITVLGSLASLSLYEQMYI